MSRVVLAAMNVVILNVAVGWAAIDLDDPAEPWKTAKVGVTTEVPPPFEPIKRTDSTVTCWGRSYKLTGLFPEKISSAGKEILDGPIRMTAKLRSFVKVPPCGRRSSGPVNPRSLSSARIGSRGRVREKCRSSTGEADVGSNTTV